MIAFPQGEMPKKSGKCPKFPRGRETSCRISPVAFYRDLNRQRSTGKETLAEEEQRVAWEWAVWEREISRERIFHRGAEDDHERMLLNWDFPASPPLLKVDIPDATPVFDEEFGEPSNFTGVEAPDPNVLSNHVEIFTEEQFVAEHRIKQREIERKRNLVWRRMEEGIDAGWNDPEPMEFSIGESKLSMGPIQTFVLRIGPGASLAKIQRFLDDWAKAQFGKGVTRARAGRPVDPMARLFSLAVFRLVRSHAVKVEKVSSKDVEAIEKELRPYDLARAVNLSASSIRAHCRAIQAILRSPPPTKDRVW